MKNEIFESTNKVAQILKVYAVVNYVALILLSIYTIPEYIFIAVVAGPVVCFPIYAFGEVIQLLSDIKFKTNGTNTTSNIIGSNTNLPKL